MPELGGAIDEQDLVELGEHQCYVRLSSGGQRLPTFSVKLDPPPATDRQHGRALAAASAERYGRDAALVEADRQSAVARVLQAQCRPRRRRGGAPSRPASPRNQHRPRKNPRSREVSPTV